MNSKEKTVKEPLFHIAKNDSMSGKQKLFVRAITVISAFLVSSIFSWILIGVNPITFIGKLFDGAFGTANRIKYLVKDLAILLGIALALAPAFKMKFWNTGAEGQVLIGGLATAAVMYYVGGNAGVPNVLLYALMFIAGVLAGAVWAVIPAICKAIWNTNETLFTLMMNYIATQLVWVCIHDWTSNGLVVKTILENRNLHNIHLPGGEFWPIVLIVGVLAVAMYLYLNYTKHGYEISVVGESENTAKYIGINVKKVIIRTVLISGAICGLIGVLLVGSIDGTVHPTDTVNGRGFTAIIVCWLAKFDPIYMVCTSFLWVFIDKGMGNLNLTNSAFTNVVSGIIIFIIIGCEFFINYKIKFAKGEKKAEQITANESEQQNSDKPESVVETENVEETKEEK